MKKLLFILFLLPVFAAAQTTSIDINVKFEGTEYRFVYVTDTTKLYTQGYPAIVNIYNSNGEPYFLGQRDWYNPNRRSSKLSMQEVDLIRNARKLKGL